MITTIIIIITLREAFSINNQISSLVTKSSHVPSATDASVISTYFKTMNALTLEKNHTFAKSVTSGSPVTTI
jgi:hypothetical protein